VRQAENAAQNEENTDLEENPLGLPSNSTSIRANIVESFTCEGKPYGYYAGYIKNTEFFAIVGVTSQLSLCFYCFPYFWKS